MSVSLSGLIRCLRVLRANYGWLERFPLSRFPDFLPYFFVTAQAATLA
jgi:hypothetical protein